MLSVGLPLRQDIKGVEKSLVHLFLESFKLKMTHFLVLSRHQEMLSKNYPGNFPASLESSIPRFWRRDLVLTEWMWVSSWLHKPAVDFHLPGAGLGLGFWILRDLRAILLVAVCITLSWNNDNKVELLKDLHRWAADRPPACFPFSLLGRRWGQALLVFGSDGQMQESPCYQSNHWLQCLCGFNRFSWSESVRLNHWNESESSWMTPN